MYINNSITLSLYVYSVICHVDYKYELFVFYLSNVKEIKNKGADTSWKPLHKSVYIYIYYIFWGVKYILFDSSFVYGFFLSLGRIITWSQPLPLTEYGGNLQKKLILYFLALAILTSLVFLLVLSETYES